MDFHDDHIAFETTSADEVSHMYVPSADDHGGLGDDTDGGPGDDHGTEPTGSHPGDTISVHVGGHDLTAAATIDVDHDGHNDTAIVEDSAGDRLAVTDTDGDGEADHAALLDDSGHVLDTAHLDPHGTWVQDGPGDSDPYGGPGATVGPDAGGHPPSTPSGGPSGGAGGTGGTGGTGGAGDAGGAGSLPGGGIPAPEHSITVHAGGHTVQAEATLDTDHDGTSDTAVVETSDGNRIAFTDSDGDGQADQASVYDTAGHLVGTAHYDPATGKWIEGEDGGTPPTLAGTGATTEAGTEPGTRLAGGGAAGGIGGSPADTTPHTGATASGDGGPGVGTAGSGHAGEPDTGVGTTPAGGTGTGVGDHVEVTVDGRSAALDAQYDADHDGHNDTAVVHSPDGTTVSFTDTNGDGDADRATVYDADGKLVGTAHYQPSSGTWVQDQR